jgi:hypothetical protein
MIKETLDPTTKTVKIEIDRAQLSSAYGESSSVAALDTFILMGLELPGNLADQLQTAITQMLASQRIDHVEIALDVPVRLKLMPQARVEEIVALLKGGSRG